MDLSNLNPLDIDLTGVNLSGADLSGTNLSQANLVGVKSAGIKGTPILPEDYSIVTIETVTGYGDYDPLMPPLYGPGFPEEYEPETQLTSYIIGPGVILEDVNLKDANLSGANLEGVNLTTVDLSGVKSGDIADGPTLSDEYKIISGLSLIHI